MTVPGRVEAAALLLSLDPPTWFTRHAAAVAEVAAWLARRAATARGRLDVAAVEAGALLHDVDKVVPPGDPARRVPHGDGSAAWLTRHGHEELAGIVAAHPVTRLLGGDAVDRWLATAPIEELIVAYADKRAGQRLESMAARFGSWERRYPGTWTAAETRVVRERAARLETGVCRLAATDPDAVRRHSWVSDALRAARSRAA